MPTTLVLTVPLPIRPDDGRPKRCRAERSLYANRLPPAEKVKTFPTTPGVYLMKGVLGDVLYVGKAKNLRSRASHYFTREAAENDRTRSLIPLIADIDFISDAFFQIRNAAQATASFDNITFFLNAIDMLAGDQSFIALRNFDTWAR